MPRLTIEESLEQFSVDALVARERALATQPLAKERQAKFVQLLDLQSPLVGGH